MRIIRCNPTGFLGYGAHKHVDLDERGMVLLYGPVGSGKSSLFNALTEILFGMCPLREDSRNATDSDIVNKAYGKACGWVEFEASDGYYRVVYTRNWKGEPTVYGPSAQVDDVDGYSGTALYFEYWDGTRWVQQDPHGKDLRYARMLDTRKRIVEVAGTDYDVFCNTSYVAQDKALNFIKGKPSEREEIITRIKGLGVYDSGALKSKERREVASAAVSELRAVENSLRSQEDRIVVVDTTSITAEIASLNEDLISIEETLQAVQSQVSAAELTRKGVENELQQARSKLDAVMKDVYSAATESNRIRSRIDDEKRKSAIAVSKIPAVTILFESLHDTCVSLRTSVTMDERRLAGMLPGAGKCPACGSQIDDITLSRHKGELESIIANGRDELRRKMDELETEKNRIESERVDHQRRIESTLAERIKEIEVEADEKMQSVLGMEVEKGKLKILVSSLEAKLRDLPSMSTAQKAMNDVMREKITRDAKITELKAKLDIADARDKDRARISSQIADVEHRRRDLETEVHEWVWLQKHYPRIKQLKFASVLHDINDRLAYYLDILTDGSTRVILSPYKVKKDAHNKPQDERTIDDYIFEFEMTVEEPNKMGVPIELYSGGEKQRITLALTSAFWRIAHDQGGGTNLLLMDEAFTFMNEVPIERSVRLIDHMRENVSTIMIVSHDPALLNFLRPDETWYAESIDGMSRLRIGGVE